MTGTLFREQILDHYRSPRNVGELAGAPIHAADANVLCGDEVTVWATVEQEHGDPHIGRMSFRGQGCAISQAAASLLTEEIPGRILSDVTAMGVDDMLRLLGIPVSPPRLKCALLALSTLQDGIARWRGANAHG